MSEPKVTFLNDIPEDHCCKTCGEKLIFQFEIYRMDSWIIKYQSCPVCDLDYICLEYEHNPQHCESIMKMQALLRGIKS